MKPTDIAYRALHKSPLLHSAYVKARFRTEIKLLKGRHEARSRHPSIIHFSLNRAASQFTKTLLCRCAEQNGMTPVHLNEFARANDMPYLDHLTAEEMAPYGHLFKPEGYCYSAFGGFVPGIPEFERFRVVFVIRDPRDVLTSLYFSTAYSHGLPADRAKGERFLANRQSVREMTVDDYVMREMGKYSARYRAYMRALEDKPNVHIAKYEDMIADFPGWLDGILSFCSLTIGDEQRDKLIAAANGSRNPKENKSRHKRQVIPGDHRRKLKPETIDALNADLADILAQYGYA